MNLSKVISLLSGVILMSIVSGRGFPHQTDVRAAQSLDELKPRIVEIIDVHDVPGVAVSIIEDNSITWSGGFGLANRLGVDTISATSSFRAASISKTVTAIAVMQLVESGGLKLSDPVQQLAPEIDIRNPWQESDPVRVVHLLEHTAGLDDMHYGNAFNVAGDGAIPLLAAINRDAHSLKVRWRPGTRFAYSNPGYAIAGYLVEKISGVSFAEYSQKRIFGPLGMKHSAVVFNNNVRSRLVQGYKKDGITPVTAYPVIFAPASGLVTSAADMGILVRALLSGGVVNGKRLLRRTSVNRMREVKTGSVAESGLLHGYGLGNYSRVTRKLAWYGHGGGLNGFSSIYAYSPDHGVGYSILINRSNATTAVTEIETQLRNYLSRNIFTSFPESRFVTQENIAVVSGWYRQANSRRTLLRPWDILFGIVHVEPSKFGVLVSPLFAGSDNYLPVSDTTFRRESEPIASLAFLHTGETVRMVTSWQEFIRVSSLSATGPAIAVLLSIAILASAVVTLPLSLIFRLARRRGRHPLAAARLLLFLGALAFFSMPVLLASADVIHLAGWNWRTLSFLGAGLTFIFLSIALFMFMLRNLKKPVPLAGKIYMFTSGLAGTLLSIGLVGWAIVGYSAWVI